MDHAEAQAKAEQAAAKLLSDAGLGERIHADVVRRLMAIAWLRGGEDAMRMMVSRDADE